MRGILQFLGFCTIVFFVVGHWGGGWFLGVAPQTPIFVYKKDAVTTLERRAINASEFPFRIEGRVREGTLTVRGSYERPTSFQHFQQQPIPERIYFEERFIQGQTVNLSEFLRQGPGIYRVQLSFEDATGMFDVDVPPSSEL